MSSRPWVRIPPALLVLADAEHRRAHCAVTAASPTVVVRLHPSACFRPGMRFFWKNTSLAPRRSGFDSRRLHFPPRPRRDTHRIEAARRKHDVHSQRRGARSGARHDLGARRRLPHDRPLHRPRRGAEPRAHRVHLLGDRAHDARRAARAGPVQPPRPLGAGGRHRPVGRDGRRLPRTRRARARTCLRAHRGPFRRHARIGDGVAPAALPDRAARGEAGSAHELLGTRPAGDADLTLDRRARLVGDRGQLPPGGREGPRGARRASVRRRAGRPPDPLARRSRDREDARPVVRSRGSGGDGATSTTSRIPRSSSEARSTCSTSSWTRTTTTRAGAC